jgi:hypothetical protein
VGGVGDGVLGRLVGGVVVVGGGVWGGGGGGCVEFWVVVLASHVGFVFVWK